MTSTGMFDDPRDHASESTRHKHCFHRHLIVLRCHFPTHVFVAHDIGGKTGYLTEYGGVKATEASLHPLGFVDMIQAGHGTSI